MTSSLPQPARDAMLPELLPITRARKDTRDVFTLELDVSARGCFAFRPGQFNMLYPFGVGESAISISGDPARPDRLVHTIRAVGAVDAGPPAAAARRPRRRARPVRPPLAGRGGRTGGTS